jgi:hypothetical protein
MEKQTSPEKSHTSHHKRRPSEGGSSKKIRKREKSVPSTVVLQNQKSSKSPQKSKKARRINQSPSDARLHLLSQPSFNDLLQAAKSEDLVKFCDTAQPAIPRLSMETLDSPRMSKIARTPTNRTRRNSDLFTDELLTPVSASRPKVQPVISFVGILTSHIIIQILLCLQ